MYSILFYGKFINKVRIIFEYTVCLNRFISIDSLKTFHSETYNMYLRSKKEYKYCYL